MNSTVRFADYGAGAIFVVAALAGCGGSSPPIAAPEATTALSARRAAAASTTPHFVQGASWMSPEAKTSKLLLYVGDWSTNDVFVYDYPSGKAVGTLTGNDEPYGMCVDAKGDVYVANFASGIVNEYAHGGTLIQTYSPGGELIGCSLDAKGDLAATSFYPGNVTVYPKGKMSGATTYSDSSCEYMWAMGSDYKGDLVGFGEYTTIDVCALLAGSKSMITLSTSGITTEFPSGVTWDGKYFVLSDQEYRSESDTGVSQATLAGKTLTYVSRTLLKGGCNSQYVDVGGVFIFGKTNVVGSKKQGTVLMAPELSCAYSGAGAIWFWHYPKAGAPFKTFTGPAEPYGAAVSIAE